MSLKVLISEDHELYRDGLKLLLQEAFSSVNILESGDFVTTLNMLETHSDIALVLFDIHIPGTTGLNGLAEVKASYPVLPLIVVSTVDQQVSIQQMLALGADGFIAKTTPKARMVQALIDVMAGETVIITEQEFSNGTGLSQRQIDTLGCLALGLANKDIAENLKISSTTVRDHVSDLLKRFDCENRTQLVLKAKELGYILE